jgi:hypothetical protein
LAGEVIVQAFDRSHDCDRADNALGVIEYGRRYGSKVRKKAASASTDTAIDNVSEQGPYTGHSRLSLEITGQVGWAAVFKFPDEVRLDNTERKMRCEVSAQGGIYYRQDTAYPQIKNCLTVGAIDTI